MDVCRPFLPIANFLASGLKVLFYFKDLTEHIYRHLRKSTYGKSKIALRHVGRYRQI